MELASVWAWADQGDTSLAFEAIPEEAHEKADEPLSKSEFPVDAIIFMSVFLPSEARKRGSRDANSSTLSHTTPSTPSTFNCFMMDLSFRSSPQTKRIKLRALTKLMSERSFSKSSACAFMPVKPIERAVYTAIGMSRVRGSK